MKCRLNLIGASLASFTLFGLPTLPTAQEAACKPLETIAAALEKEAGEQPAFRGISEAGDNMTVLYVNPTTGSWTVLLLIMVDKHVCAQVAAYGQGGITMDYIPPSEEG